MKNTSAFRVHQQTKARNQKTEKDQEIVKNDKQKYQKHHEEEETET